LPHLRQNKLFLAQDDVVPPVLGALITEPHSQSIKWASLNTQTTEHATPGIYLKLANHVIVLSADMGHNLNIPLGTTLGTSVAASTSILKPHQLVASYAARRQQLLLGILHRNWRTKEMSKGYRHSFGYANAISIKLQLDRLPE
jgi:hypothetical protein